MRPAPPAGVARRARRPVASLTMGRPAATRPSTAADQNAVRPAPSAALSTGNPPASGRPNAVPRAAPLAAPPAHLTPRGAAGTGKSAVPRGAGRPQLTVAAPGVPAVTCSAARRGRPARWAPTSASPAPPVVSRTHWSWVRVMASAAVRQRGSPSAALASPTRAPRPPCPVDDRCSGRGHHRPSLHHHSSWPPLSFPGNGRQTNAVAHGDGGTPGGNSRYLTLARSRTLRAIMVRSTGRDRGGGTIPALQTR